MSYCLVRTMMIAHVQEGQLVCSKYKIKLIGDKSLQLHNFMQRVFFEFNGRILLENEEDRAVLPTETFRTQAVVPEGTGSVFSRIIQLALQHNIQCRVINGFKDISHEIASVFFLTQTSGVSCQVLETDKDELCGKTILIGADPNVEYAGRNLVPLAVDENYDVDDKLLGNNLFSLYDDNSKLMVMVGK